MRITTMGTMVTHLIALVVLGIFTCACGHATFPWTMEHFIKVVEQVETSNPGQGALGLVRVLRSFGGLEDAFVQHFLGPLKDESPILAPEASDFLQAVIGHRVTGKGEEEGVVLTADGTTVALTPLLLGIEAGLLAAGGSDQALSGLYPLTLAKALGLSFLQPHSSPLHTEILGPDGCWDSMTSPRIFALSAPAGGAGLDSAPRLISPWRRGNFRELANTSLLQGWVVESLALYRKLIGDPGLAEGAESETAIKEGVKEFVRRYMECPTIIPRCQWGAKPYRGTPTQLTLPLSFLYVHHTYEPGQPCLSFQQCAANMRSMQRFHQEDRGWDDIGYSFVAGSDGYIYEGRGWHWQGAHTLGHNSRGYGVSFIGDYTATLPSQRSLELVRDRLAACAVGGGG
ncbi:hypothetical protein AGOR_G00222580 [Albula goreensis]|uniref:Peptidoglycan recognition protein family domain-containing protein n=1 Tax=Albula goreensis TaxID=1534307 RepID=A0A8T3CNE7_9TELE|nr:hypothetical protein AGOR_G00222580 [Albula goreensis]